jgi:hypothetical protein
MAQFLAPLVFGVFGVAARESRVNLGFDFQGAARIGVEFPQPLDGLARFLVGFPARQGIAVGQAPYVKAALAWQGIGFFSRLAILASSTGVGGAMLLAARCGTAKSWPSR